ncbi:MAG: protein of unknown function DUF4197, partial [Porphyrobacter sp. HL-46]
MTAQHDFLNRRRMMAGIGMASLLLLPAGAAAQNLGGL